MVLQGDVSDWLQGSQVAISATEYPSPPQTTETEVWLGMAATSKRSLFWGEMFCEDFLNKSAFFFCQQDRKRRDHIHVIDDTLTIPTPVEGAYDFRSVLPGLDITKPSMMRHAQQILLSYE